MATWEDFPVATAQTDDPAWDKFPKADDQQDWSAFQKAAASPVTASQAPQNPSRLADEGDTAYMSRTGVWPPPGKEEVESDEPLIPAKVIKAGYTASPFHWAAKAFPDSSYAKAEEGIEQGASETAAGLTTPGNAAMLATAPIMPGGVIGKLGGTALGAYFEAQAVKNFPDEWKQFQETTDPQEKWKLGTQMAAGLGLPLTVLTHTMAGEAKPTGEEATATPETPTPQGEATPNGQIRPPIQRVSPETGQTFYDYGKEGDANANRDTTDATLASEKVQSPTEAPQPEPTGITETLAELKRRNVVTPGEVLPQDVPQTTEAHGEPMEDVGISGVANRVYQAKADQGLAAEIPSGEGMSAEDVINLGRQKISEGVDPNEVATRFAQDKRLSAEDFGVLRARGEDLDQAVKAAEREVVRDPDNPIKRQAADQAAKEADNWHRNIVQPAKTATSDIFRGMQGETDLDTESFYTMRRAFEDINKRSPMPQEQLRMAENVAKVQKVIGDRQTAINGLHDEIMKRAPRAKAKIVSVDQLRDFVAQKLKETAPC